MKVRYYLTSSGRSPVEEFMHALAESSRLEILEALVMLESGRSLDMPLSRNLSSIHPGLHELRVRDKAGQVRIIYYLKKREALYLIHAFRKKTRGIPKRDLKVVLRRVKEI